VCGFSLVELTVVVAIIVALAAVVIPVVGSAREDRHVAQMLRVVDALRGACLKYYSDTGSCARELSSSDAAIDHQLALRHTVGGWRGPYINPVLSQGDNPFGGTVHVYGGLGMAFQGGFRLTSGSGAITAKGLGNFVRFTSIPSSVAKGIDAQLDEGIPGPWKKGGRVTYSGTNLYIFLLDTDGR